MEAVERREIEFGVLGQSGHVFSVLAHDEFHGVLVFLKGQLQFVILFLQTLNLSVLILHSSYQLRSRPMSVVLIDDFYFVFVLK